MRSLPNDGWLGRLRRRDDLVLRYLVGRRHRRLDPLMDSLTHLGDAAVVISFVLIIMVVPDAAWAAAGREAGFALAFSHGLVQFLKRSIARQRPVLPKGCESLIRAPDRFSFPSGHAAAALSIGLVVGPLLGASALVVPLALLVGVTRCYLGVHYPGDVAIGWLLAATGVWAARLIGI